jgi:hypothetical protein
MSGAVVAYVPCDGCVLCCRGDAIRILPHEDVSRWKTEPHPSADGARMLAHKLNGDCIYLAPGGCSIHPDRPQQCRTMDCRTIAASITWTQARKLAKRNALPIAVYNRGRQLSKAQP